MDIETQHLLRFNVFRPFYQFNQDSWSPCAPSRNVQSSAVILTQCAHLFQSVGLGRRKILDEHLTDSKHLVKSMLFVLPVSFWKTSDVSGCPTHAWFPQDETCTSPKKHTFSKPMVSKPMVASPFLGVKTWQGVFQPYGFPLGPWLAGVRRAVCGWNDDAGGSSLVSDGCLDGLNGCTHIGSMVLVYIYIFMHIC